MRGELMQECQPWRTASPCSLVSSPASVKGTPKSLGDTPIRTRQEMPGPLSIHPGNAHHQVGSLAASWVHPGVLLPGVATMGGAWPWRI